MTQKPVVRQPVANRPSCATMLGPNETKVMAQLAETPELTAPDLLEKLRADGYRGGLTILQE